MFIIQRVEMKWWVGGLMAEITNLGLWGQWYDSFAGMERISCNGNANSTSNKALFSPLFQS